jgi:LysR family transcriptional regulator, nitrogen assimilation regulatory protein
MTLTQLANFVRIAELQSLSKAAAAIRIAQPALSRQVRNLEIELGNALLIRHAWGVTLTPAGEVLVARARRLLVDAENTRDAVLALTTEPTGLIAIGVPSSVSTTLLPELAAALREKYPRLRPHFVEGFSAVLHARTLSGELDLAALYDDRAIGPLATTPLLAENLMLVGPPDGEVGRLTTSADLLASRPLILPARPNRLRLIVDEALARRPQAEGPAFEMDSLSAIIAMVERGAGWTVLPFSTVAAAVACGAVKVWDLQYPQLSRTLLLVRPVDRQATPAVFAVQAEIRALVGWMAPAMQWRSLSEAALA